MAIQEPNWPTYADKVHDWIQEAYARVYDSQEQMSTDQSKAALAASYCLLAAHDYLEIAFFAFHKKLYHPGMACLRPVAEMAIDFFWCTFLVDDYVDRLGRWAKRSFDQSRKTYESLEHWVLSESDRKALGPKKAEWEKRYEQLFEDIKADLPPVLNMLEEIDKRQGGEVAFRSLYPMLYSTLCSSAHGVLVLDRYFRPAGSAIDRRKHAPMPPDGPWASLTAIVYLVVGIYKFFGWEYSKFLSEYKQLLEPSGAKGSPGTNDIEGTQQHPSEH